MNRRPGDGRTVMALLLVSSILLCLSRLRPAMATQNYQDDNVKEPESSSKPSFLSEDMIKMIVHIKGGSNLHPKNSNTDNKYGKSPARKRSKKRSRTSEEDISTKSEPTQNQHHDAMSTSVTVQIPGYGKAEGRREGGVDIWKGLPYAAPPVGSLRFAPPEAAPPWAPSRLDASKFGPDCFQMVDPLLNPAAESRRMSEDCLYLNVFTPAGHEARSREGRFLSGTKLLPVMVWLHGGAFQQGGARRQEYDGRRLAERDIIIVTINYRLGALGFMVSSTDGLYGNFGLMDQRAALDWVKTNIRAFGGDPDNITLFGESAGAVMIGLHLLMEGAGTLFHKAIMQSNPLGYTFRSVVIADFIGEALKRAVDCRDLACLRAERVEEIMRAQTSLMGVPRSVGDFFTWSPTLTKETKLKLSLTGDGRMLSRSEEHRLPRLDMEESKNSYISEWRLGGDEMTSDSARWSGVNVSQPMKFLKEIPDDIPIMIGSNAHEGEMFVHSAFPAPMPKAVYWMFVGALFRDSASRVLRHYRGLVDEVEREAEELAKEQLEEEENKQEYLENKEQLDSEYEMLLTMNQTRRGRENIDVVGSDGLRTLVKTWSTGGFLDQSSNTTSSEDKSAQPIDVIDQFTVKTFGHRLRMMARRREEKRIEKLKLRALKEAAKVVVDYRPVMSAIISDYLFRCPSWHFAQLLSSNREKRGKHGSNVYVYRFSQPTHIPGYKECWGKSCHTAELPYVFQAMDIMRSNYSTLGPWAQQEAPSAPEYPFSQIMAAYRGALEAVENIDENEYENFSNVDKIHGESSVAGNGRNHTKGFQRILNHFFGDYFTEDSDEEMASDMAERWTSFARDSSPNYDGSRAEWLPWRHISESNTPFGYDSRKFDHVNDAWSKEQSFWSQGDDEYDYWSEYDDEEDVGEEGTSVDEFGDDDVVSGRSSRDIFYRRRALEALKVDVIHQDVFRTELRRMHYRKNDEDMDRAGFLKGKFFQNKLKKYQTMEETPVQPMSKAEGKEAIRLAQELGLLGVGLDEKTTEGDVGAFFPELFELSWPPEGRLIERDCTCDLWDRIRYRY